MQKGAELEEWCDNCKGSACRRQEGLRLAQAESEGRGRAVGADAGGLRGAGAEAGAGRPGGGWRETRPSCQ